MLKKLIKTCSLLQPISCNQRQLVVKRGTVIYPQWVITVAAKNITPGGKILWNLSSSLFRIIKILLFKLPMKPYLKSTGLKYINGCDKSVVCLWVILCLMATVRQPVVCSRTAWECDCCCVWVLQQGVYGFDMQNDGTKSESAQSVISQEDLTFLYSPQIVLPVNKWQLLLARGSHLLTQDTTTPTVVSHWHVNSDT